MNKSIWQETENIKRIMEGHLGGKVIFLPNGGSLITVNDQDVHDTVVDIVQDLFEAYADPTNANTCEACGLQTFSKMFVIEDVHACIACGGFWLMCRDLNIDIDWPPPHQRMYEHVLRVIGLMES